MFYCYCVNFTQQSYKQLLKQPNILRKKYTRTSKKIFKTNKKALTDSSGSPSAADGNNPVSPPKNKCTFHYGHTKEQITHPEILRIGYNDKNNANKNRTAVDAWISSSAAVMLVCAVNQYTIGNGGASTASSDKYKKGRIFYTRTS